jgi:hypothetical protein
MRLVGLVDQLKVLPSTPKARIPGRAGPGL